MAESPPSTVRVIKHEAISPNEVRITMEVIVNVDRLTEICGEMLHTTTQQIARRKPKR
ncbi:MAG TPA: hypothetical protein VFV07_01680 [Rhizomicrobium sp.]|nr:hypothetical protein [Rhizomicrobium sp.]